MTEAIIAINYSIKQKNQYQTRTSLLKPPRQHVATLHVIDWEANPSFQRLRADQRSGSAAAPAPGFPLKGTLTGWTLAMHSLPSIDRLLIT